LRVTTRPFSRARYSKTCWLLFLLAGCQPPGEGIGVLAVRTLAARSEVDECHRSSSWRRSQASHRSSIARSSGQRLRWRGEMRASIDCSSPTRSL